MTVAFHKIIAAELFIAIQDCGATPLDIPIQLWPTDSPYGWAPPLLQADPPAINVGFCSRVIDEQVQEAGFTETEIWSYIEIISALLAEAIAQVADGETSDVAYRKAEDRLHTTPMGDVFDAFRTRILEST